MPDYYCDVCKERTQPELRDVGASASCCLEARLLVDDDGLIRLLTEREERELGEELYAEADAERTPRQRARFNSLNRS